MNIILWAEFQMVHKWLSLFILYLRYFLFFKAKNEGLANNSMPKFKIMILLFQYSWWYFSLFRMSVKHNACKNKIWMERVVVTTDNFVGDKIIIIQIVYMWSSWYISYEVKWLSRAYRQRRECNKFHSNLICFREGP